jgi:hypothetical protein
MLRDTHENKAIPFIVKEQNNCTPFKIQPTHSRSKPNIFSPNYKVLLPSSQWQVSIAQEKAISLTESFLTDQMALASALLSIPAPKGSGCGQKQYEHLRDALYLSSIQKALEPLMNKATTI